MTNSNTVNTVELNATKSVEIDAASGSGGFVVAVAQALITPAPLPDDKSVAAAELIEMLEKANTFFKDEQAKIISRDEASARFAAYMVKIGAKYHHDAEFRLALDTECVERRIPLAPAPGSTEYNDAVKNGRAPMNAFLPVVKLVDGEWGSRMDRRGKPVTDASGNIETMWYHNRSLEKYAPFIECCIRNNLTEAIEGILLKGGEFEICVGAKVKATITAIVAFNAKQKGAISRTPTVWKTEVRAAAAKVQPLFTRSEDGYAAAIIRFTDNGLEILGDLLLSGNPLLEKVKTQTETMTRLNAAFVKSTEGGKS